MAAHRTDALPDGPAWLYELKLDGYRALIIKDGDAVEIRSRNDRSMTALYPGVVAAARRLGARSAVVDGEVVAVDRHGRPSFQALQHRSEHPDHAVAFYGFDLLHLDGEALVERPLEVRIAALPGLLHGSGLLCSEPLPGSASEVADAVRRL
jgi:bifunctional non-homologous end joining protein LigD